MSRAKATQGFALLAAIVIVLLAGCGGGGGGGAASSASPPFVFATLTSFPTGGVPAGFASAGHNSLIFVDVLDNSTGAPISNASVSLNGTSLAYDPIFQDYAAEVVVDPADDLVLRVTVSGVTYIATATQFTAYPSISAPLSDAAWSSNAANLVSWSSVAPATPSLYALGVLDLNGNLEWPSDGFQFLPTSESSFTIGAGNLTTGSRIVMVGLGTSYGIASAAPGSAMVLIGFNYVPITVNNGPGSPLVSIDVTPPTATISIADTRQLTATGRYAANFNVDLTAQVMWSSSDPAKITVDAAGLVTGVDFGSATITATLDTISGSTTVKIFQPTPSPAPPLSQAVAYQIDYAHSGFATFGATLNFPSNPTWSVTLDGPASYPLIASGKVFVVTGFPGGGPSLYALDKSTGNIVWGPVFIGQSWAGHAYDNGKIFVVNHGGLLRSFDATTGQAGWSVQLPNQHSFSSPPTAVNGVVYTGGAGNAGTVYAVDQANGDLLWTAGVWNGHHSSPTVSSDGIFVSYPCQVYKLHPYTGTSLWHYPGPCSGGGGRTAAYADGLLYVRDPGNNPYAAVFNAATGTLVGNFPSTTGFPSTKIPAISAQAGYVLAGATLQSFDLVSLNVLWTFVGDGQLVLGPVVIDDRVIVGSATGNVYALDAASGTQIWNGNAGAAISEPDEHNLDSLTGLGAGEGYLVVPAGNVVTAWHLSGP